MATGLTRIDVPLRDFLEDMISRITREYGDEIVSIGLFGSATTKDWVRGRSDIDFIIVIKHEEKRQVVENSMNRILLELDRKYDLQLTQTCSTFARHANPMVNFFLKLENALMFGRPFFVFSLNQIAFEKGTINDAKIRLVTTVFDPLSIFLAKMKQTGTTIYGENLISQMKFSTSAVDKVRIAMAPLWLVTMSLLSFPVDGVFSLKHSMKATLWACEDVLFALDISLSTNADEASIISDIFGKGTGVDLTHLKKTVALRSEGFSNEITKGFVAKYVLSTMLFISTLYYNTSAVLRAHSHDRYFTHQYGAS